MDQDRDAAVGCELEHRRQPLVVEQELLRARVQLDPAGAEVEAARRLLDRALGQVEPDERNELAAASLGEGERAVVRRAEARMPVGLVEAEHERAGDPVRTLDPEQLVEVAAHAVDVGAEMDVRVEDLGVLRQLCPHVVLEALDEALRAPKDVLHEPESTDGGWRAIRVDARFETRRTGAPPVRGKRRSHPGEHAHCVRRRHLFRPWTRTPGLERGSVMRDLPERPSLEHYRREAKELVRAFRAGDEDVPRAGSRRRRPRPLPARRRPARARARARLPLLGRVPAADRGIASRRAGRSRAR